MDLKLMFEAASYDGADVIALGFHTDEAKIIEVSCGNALVSVGTESLEAGEGDYIFVPAKLVYKVDAVGVRSSVRVLSFNDSALFEYMEKIDIDLYYMFCVQARNRIAVFSKDHPIYEMIAYSFSEAFDEYSAKEVCYTLTVKANLFSLISTVLRNYSNSKDELDRMVYHNVLRLRPALDYITEHCGEKIYIDTLADMISVSPDYFTKVFKESIGKTPIDYINAVRVNRALELLAVTDVPLGEIAEKSGFANPNYFHKIFKQYMVTSPLVYRKSVKNRSEE